MEAEGAVGAGLVPTAESGIPSVYGRRGRWSPGLSAASSQRLGACAAPSLLVAARSGRIHFYVICRGSVPDLASGQTGRLGAWARPLGTEPCGVHVTRGQLGETPDVCCNCPDVETPVTFGKRSSCSQPSTPSSACRPWSSPRSWSARIALRASPNRSELPRVCSACLPKARRWNAALSWPGPGNPLAWRRPRRCVSESPAKDE
jgi:hypothetical protein